MTQPIIITKVFNAPLSTVWDAWTIPEQMKQWWGPEHFTSPIVKIDFQTGGKYHACMRGPDGKDYWSGGRYTEIVLHKRIVCTDHFADEEGNFVDPSAFGMGPDFPKESVVTVTFAEHDGKTTLTILYQPPNQAAHDAMIHARMVDGWNSSLSKLAILVEKTSRTTP